MFVDCLLYCKINVAKEIVKLNILVLIKKQQHSNEVCTYFICKYSYSVFYIAMVVIIVLNSAMTGTNELTPSVRSARMLAWCANWVPVPWSCTEVTCWADARTRTLFHPHASRPSIRPITTCSSSVTNTPALRYGHIDTCTGQHAQWIHRDAHVYKRVCDYYQLPQATYFLFYKTCNTELLTSSALNQIQLPNKQNT